MTKSTLRTLIIILTLITVAVHGVILQLGGLDVLFALNAIGYLVLLYALLKDVPAGQSTLVHWAFIAFTAATILGWVFLNYLRGFGDALGYITKIDEVLLIVFLYMHLQREA